MRDDSPWEADEVRAALENKVEAIVFTNKKAKNLAVWKAGFYPSVWIDDNPLFIIQDAQESASHIGAWE